MVIAVLFMGSTLLTPLYELYQSAYALSPFVLVLLYAVYVVGNLLALFLFGRLSDQIGRKPVTLAALALAGASAVLFLLAANPKWLFIARIMSGLAVGIGSGAATAWISEFTPAEQRPRAAATMTGFNFVGLALGPVIGGTLVEYAPHPLRLPFVVYLLLLVLLVLLVATQRETVTGQKNRTSGSGSGFPMSLEQRSSPPR